MKLSEEAKKIIKECATNISSIIYGKVDDITVEAIENQVNALIVQGNSALENNDSTSVVEGFNGFYRAYFTEALINAVRNNDAEEYGKKLDKEMTKIFNAMPDEYKDLCKGKNPLEIEDYEVCVKSAFAERISLLYREKYEVNEPDLYKKSILELKGATDKCVEELTNNNDEADEVAYHALVSKKYDLVKQEHEKLGFFKKYLWPTGYRLRSAMKYAESKMNELNKEKAFTDKPMDEYLDMKAMSVSNQLYNAKQAVVFFNDTKYINVDTVELKTGNLEIKESPKKISLDLNENDNTTSMDKDEVSNDAPVASI